MRDKDVLTAAYLKNNSRFADLLNGWLFGGHPVVRPEDIQELDSAEIRIRRGPGDRRGTDRETVPGCDPPGSPWHAVCGGLCGGAERGGLHHALPGDRL